MMDDAETFRNGFENSYNAIFVQDCHNQQSQKQRNGFSTVFLSETCGKF